MRLNTWAAVPLAASIAAVMASPVAKAEVERSEHHSMAGRGQRPVKALGDTMYSARGSEATPLLEVMSKRLSSLIAPLTERGILDETIGGLRNDTDDTDDDDDDTYDNDDDDDDDSNKSYTGGSSTGRKPTSSGNRTSTEVSVSDEQTREATQTGSNSSTDRTSSSSRKKQTQPTSTSASTSSPNTKDQYQPSDKYTSTQDSSSWNTSPQQTSGTRTNTGTGLGGIIGGLLGGSSDDSSYSPAPTMTKSRKPKQTSSWSTDSDDEGNKSTSVSGLYNGDTTDSNDDRTTAYKTGTKDRTSTTDDSWRPSRTSTADKETGTEARPKTTTSPTRGKSTGGLLGAVGGLLGGGNTSTKDESQPSSTKEQGSTVTSAPTTSSKKGSGGLIGGLNSVLTGSNENGSSASAKKKPTTDQSSPTDSNTGQEEGGLSSSSSGSGQKTQTSPEGDKQTTSTNKTSGGLVSGLVGGLTDKPSKTNDGNKPTVTSAPDSTKTTTKTGADQAGTKSTGGVEGEAGTKNTTSTGDSSSAVGGLIGGDEGSSTKSNKTGKGTATSSSGAVGGLLGTSSTAQPDTTSPQNQTSSNTGTGAVGGATGALSSGGEDKNTTTTSTTAKAGNNTATQAPETASPSATSYTPLTSTNETGYVGGLQTSSPTSVDGTNTTTATSAPNTQTHGTTSPAPSPQKSTTPPPAIAGIQPDQAYGYANSAQLLMPTTSTTTSAKAGTQATDNKTDNTNNSEAAAPATNKPAAAAVANTIVPAGSASSQPSDTVVVAILFKSPLTWTFLAQSPNTVAQLFGYMPSIIAECISLQPSDVSTMRLQSYYAGDDKTDVNKAQSVYLAYVPTKQAKNLAEQVKQYNQSAFYTMPSAAVAKQIVAQVDPQFDVLSMGTSVKANSDMSGQYNGDKSATLRNALVGVGAALAACIIGFIAWRLYKRSKKTSRRQTSASAGNDRATTIRSFGGSNALRETWAPSENEQERVLHGQLAETWDHAIRYGQGAVPHPEMGYRNYAATPWALYPGHANPFDDVRGNRGSRETERSVSSAGSAHRDALMSAGRAQQGSRGGSDASHMTEAQRIQHAYMESRGSLSGSQGEAWQAANRATASTPNFQDEYDRPQQYTSSHQYGPRSGENRTHRKRTSRGSISGSSIGRPEMRSNSMLF